MEEKKDEKNGSFGCGVAMFIFTAAGIPFAVKGEGPIGSLVITIFGLVIAYFFAREVSNGL